MTAMTVNACTGALATVTPLVGDLDKYIRYINQLPILSEKEEEDLACRLRDHNDLEAARQLVLSHLRVVVSVARNFLGYGLPFGDLIQEGNIGLMRAVRLFNPDRGVRLVSYALHWVRAYIYDFIQKNVRMVKSSTTRVKRKLFFNLRAMKRGSGAIGHQEAEEISEKLDVPIESVMEMDGALSHHDLSLDMPINAEGTSPIEHLEAETARPDQMMEAKDEQRLHTEGLQTALAQLDERSQKIVRARWLSDAPATLHQLAAELSISHERVRQIEVRAFKKMREHLSAHYIELPQPSKANG